MTVGAGELGTGGGIEHDLVVGGGGREVELGPTHAQGMGPSHRTASGAQLDRLAHDPLAPLHRPHLGVQRRVGHRSEQLDQDPRHDLVGVVDQPDQQRTDRTAVEHALVPGTSCGGGGNEAAAVGLEQRGRAGSHPA